MIPLLTSAQIKAADLYTIKNEPVNSIDLMERAASVCCRLIQKQINHKQPVNIFCGPGNNGGDGLAIGRMLALADYHVKVYAIRSSAGSSKDFIENEKRLLQCGNNLLINIDADSNLPPLAEDEIVIDCIFGYGLNKPPDGLFKAVIQHINQSRCRIIAIDLPSGLFADSSSVLHKDAIINASQTITFQVLKLAFLFPENARHTGQLSLADIKLSSTFISSLRTKKVMIERTDVEKIITARMPFSHKGTYGHALILSGSLGKAGAAILCAKACLRSGAGLVTVKIPSCAYGVLQTALPEAMVITDSNNDYLSEATSIQNYNAIAVGPGIGTEKDTANILKQIIQNAQQPLVLDADALNILADNKTWLSFLPPQSILTPHVREFERLAGKTSNDFERHQLQIDFAVKNNCYLILKGRYTCIATPKGNCFFNSTGNAGMATAGAGDVLTGIITGLLAQGLHPAEACIAGVYLHGLAGDLALHVQSEQSLIAADITEHLGQAYKELSNTVSVFS